MASKIDSMSRAELEAESVRLSKAKVEIKAEENAVNGRLDAFRELDRLNIDPDKLQEIARAARLQSRGDSEAEASNKEAAE